MGKRKKKFVPQDENLEEKITTEEPVESMAEEVSTPEETISNEVESTQENEPESEMISEPEIQTQEIVYLGISEKATVRGKVTGQKYSFYKDAYGMPQPSTVDERDASGILSLEGKACCGKDPNKLYMTKVDWDIEIQQAKQLNS